MHAFLQRRTTFLGAAALVVALAAAEQPPPGLFWCGTKHDFSGDQIQVIQAFQFIGGVCCNQLQEHCNTDVTPIMPDSCYSATCARAVNLTYQACKDFFARNAFENHSWMPALGPAMSVCDGMDHSREEPGIAITEPGARETPLSCGSVIVDGMGVHNFSTDGRDYIAVKVPTGNTAIFEIEAVYLGSAEVLIYDSDVSELIATLRGKSLPTRTFNTTGNEATIVVTTQDQSEQQPELFRIRIGCGCTADVGCEPHGKCGPDGKCYCENGGVYFGDRCDHARGYTVTGALPPRDGVPELNGDYLLVNGLLCNGKPVYQTRGKDGPMIYSPTQGDWFIGPAYRAKECQASGYLYQSNEPICTEPGHANCTGMWFQNERDCIVRPTWVLGGTYETCDAVCMATQSSCQTAGVRMDSEASFQQEIPANLRTSCGTITSSTSDMAPYLYSSQGTCYYPLTGTVSCSASGSSSYQRYCPCRTSGPCLGCIACASNGVNITIQAI